MTETIANTTAGITKSSDKLPTPIVMQVVINSSPRKAGSAGAGHRRSDNKTTAKNRLASVWPTIQRGKLEASPSWL
jgi:hypothetical protein